MVTTLRHLVPVLGLAMVTVAEGQSFTPGRIAVLEYTTGSLSGGPYVIREFSKDGLPTASFQIPSTGPDAVVGTLNLTTGSQLARTPTGDALYFTGFAESVAYPTSLTTTSSAQIPRVVGRIDASGSCTREYATNALFSGETMTHVAVDGNQVWTGSQSTGVCLFGPGAQQVINSISSRGLRFENGQLYSCTTSGTDGVLQIGQGSPTAPTSATSVFPVPNAMDVQFSPDGNTAYAVYGHNRVRKMVWNGSVWTNPYDLFCAPSNWLVRIAVDFSGPDPVVYGVHNAPTKLVRWVDLGAGSPEELLYQATGQAFYYGIAFTPGSCVAGAPCDDGDLMTVNDLLDAACNCSGQPTDCLGVIGGGAVTGSTCDDGDPLTAQDSYRSDCSCAGSSVYLHAKAYLGGALPQGWFLMRDSLRVRGLLPTTEPYSALGLAPTPAGQTIDPGLLSVSGPNGIVDWVLVELRAASDATVLVARRAALLQRDGDLVDLDGASPLRFPAVPDDLYIAIRHRNHLGIMTNAPVSLSEVPMTIDLRQTSTSLFGNTPCMPITAGIQALWPGDANGDGTVKYVGTDNDRDMILNAVGGVVPTGTFVGYHGADIGLDGTVRYTGNGNDRDAVLGVIGGSVPTQTRQAQLP